ncbi:phage tail spike protein [Paenibacillus turicensis]|uniref:phage tail spike protein n=1 Tax=Paenibacillus turicensis TaxID=160487 RepID=UPI003D2B07DA
MLGEIDYHKKPIQPQYFLCKPNREIISKLSEAFNDRLSISLNSVDELILSLPYQIEIRHQLTRNKNVDLIHEKYLIKMVTNKDIAWFIIHEISEEVSNNSDVKTLKCYSCSHELTNKLIKSYSVESYYCRQVLKDLLANTIWEIDYIDADFDLTYRAFDFPSSNVLEAIYSVADTYNAIVEFNTDQRKISFKKPELFGTNKGLTISYGKYMKSMNQTISAEQMVTRLVAKGKDELSIHKVNPTGQGYIEDFSYFMYPFERNDQQQVKSSSYHMSDSLCHAILDYQLLVEESTGQFEARLKQLKQHEQELGQLEVELNKLKNNEAVITDVVLSQQFDGKMFFERYAHVGSSSKTFEINKLYPFAVLIKVDQDAVNAAVGDLIQRIPANKWTLLGKVKDIESLQVNVEGAKSNVFIQVANITLDEWSSPNNHDVIIQKYSLDNKENEIGFKLQQITQKQNQIKGVQAQIDALQDKLLAHNNFTPAQLQELNPYVIEREFSDDTYVDEHDLYLAAQEKFAELQRPALSLDIDIVNFLEIIEEQRNWDKLMLGDFINIKYEPTQTKITARIVNITFDYEKSDIKLTLSNIKDVHDESKSLEKFLHDAKSTNIIVDTNKSKWGKAVISSNNMTKLFENFWNNVTEQINMANNEFVHIDHRGITIYDIHDPNKFVRMTHGAIGMTDNGGLLYKMAITPTHIVAENVWGKLFVGERLTLGDVDGLLEITGPKFMIFDRQGRLVQQMGLLATNPDLFGTEVLHYNTENSGDNTVINKVTMTNNNGFRIERNVNGEFQPIFKTTPEGDLYVRAGTDDEVFTINEQGLALGSSDWENAPFHADYKGNVWMNKLFAFEADIKKSKFTDGHIKGSDLILEDGKGGIISMFPQYGLWFGAEKAEDAPTWIKMDGTGIFKKLIVKDKDDGLMIDSEAKKIFMDNWDLVGAGMVDTELLAANLVSAEFGYISDLTASKLSTMSRSAINAYANFINIEKNNIKWITGKVVQGEQKKLSDGRPLFWLDASQTGKMTTDTTPYPVYEYILDKETTKTKMEQGFDDSGDNNPFITMGAGDGSSETSGKANLKKYNGGFKVSYNTSNSGRDMSIDFKDNGVYVNAETDKVQIQGKDFEVKAQGGKVTIADASGSMITLENGNIKIKATGRLDVEATSYNFN